jgi:heme-degrading monooxygenase HmoA
MIIQRIELSVVPGREIEFEAALAESRQHVFTAPGFRRLNVARGMERPSVYLIEIVWESTADLVSFGNSALAGHWVSALREYLAETPHVEPFEQRLGLSLVAGGAI